MIVLIICYDRVHNLQAWEAAWNEMDVGECELVFAITGNIEYNTPHKVIRYPNIGMDIGVLKRFIDSESDYDRLFWCPDDFLPLRPDLLNLYDTADVVGTFWSIEEKPHIRSGGVAITEEVAKALVFPATMTTSRAHAKSNCYSFEHLKLNFYDQVKDKFSVKMVDGTTPPNSPNWRDVPSTYLLDSLHKTYMRPF